MKNYSRQIFIIIVSVTIIFTILSFLQTRFHVLSFTSRPVDLLSEIKTKDSSIKNEDTTVKPEIKNKKFEDYKTFNGIVHYDSESAALSKFIQALKELKQKTRKKVRIAYFGDSVIEGDLLTQDLRSALQKYFGGKGVGFVPITSIVAGFRTTIRHDFSDNWTDKHFKNSQGNNLQLFLSGHQFFSGGSSWVLYRDTAKAPQNIIPFLVYGKPVANVDVVFNNKIIALNGNQVFNWQKIETPPEREFKFVVKSNSTAFYGVSFESEEGIIVDNFAFRGISGIEYNNIDTGFLQNISSTVAYDLLVFQFGPNLLFRPNLKEFNWYTKNMKKVIERFKSIFQNSSILVVSTGDKAFRYNGQYKTAIGVEPLVDEQNEMALQTGVNFWNLYKAMGGEGSMIKWVEGDTTFANKDYTHFTNKGARKIGLMLYDAMMKIYNNEKE